MHCSFSSQDWSSGGPEVGSAAVTKPTHQDRDGGHRPPEGAESKVARTKFAVLTDVKPMRPTRGYGVPLHNGWLVDLQAERMWQMGTQLHRDDACHRLAAPGGGAAVQASRRRPCAPRRWRSVAAASRDVTANPASHPLHRQDRPHGQPQEVAYSRTG